VELTTLPGHGGEDSGPGGAQTGMVISDNERHALNIHLGQGQLEGLLAANAFLQR
jgi:hypothetical protein